MQSRTYVWLSTFKVSATGFASEAALATAGRGREAAGLRTDFLVTILEIPFETTVYAIPQLRMPYKSSLQSIVGASENTQRRECVGYSCVYT